MRIKFLASVTAALSLAFIPTMAQAVATTLTLNEGGTSTAATGLEDGDSLDVTVAGPVAKTGPATHELYSTWSAQSLGLTVADLAHPADDITWPEGWSLEYTIDGTTWVNWEDDAPSDLGSVIAIRSLGDVNSVGENTFETTASGNLWVEPFSANGGGDGFDVAVGPDKIINVYHHEEGGSIRMECHTYAGEACETMTYTVSGYGNNYSSRAFYDDSNDHLYTYAMNLTTGDYGVICVDWSDVSNVVDCGWDVLASTTGEGQYDYGSQSQVGTRIWSIVGSTGDLMCFDMSVQGACDQNGWYTGFTGESMSSARVTAVNGLVYFTSADKFGCYDVLADALCSATNPVDLATHANRHAPIPVEDASGTVTGACDLENRVCIDLDGDPMTIPTELDQFWDEFPPDDDNASSNMSQFAYGNHRIWYDTGVDGLGDWASNNVTCYDFLTESACVGFDGFNRPGIELIYSATYDESTPDCVWINTHVGVITPMNNETGTIGCDLGGTPVVQLDYNAVTPRLGCVEEGRILEWASIDLQVPAGIAMSDVQLSFYDSEGVEVAGWTNLSPDTDGHIDLTELTTADTGTQPSIRITAGDVASSALRDVVATVTFVAEDPQLCFTLSASNNCETTVVDSPPAGSIADGIVEGTSITRPDSGKDVGTKERTTLPGANAADMCVASALEIDLPISQLASTGVDAGGIAIAGFAVLAAGVAAVAVTRRRKA